MKRITTLLFLLFALNGFSQQYFNDISVRNSTELGPDSQNKGNVKMVNGKFQYKDANGNWIIPFDSALKYSDAKFNAVASGTANAFHNTVPDTNIKSYYARDTGIYTSFFDTSGAAIHVFKADLDSGIAMLYKIGTGWYKSVQKQNLALYAQKTDLKALEDTLKGYTTDTIFVEQKPNTALSSMSINGGATGYKVFNNFDYSTVRTFTKIKLYNPSGSPRQFKVIKLAVDGTTTTDIQTFTFPASSITEFSLTTPAVLQVGERIGIEMLEASFRYVATGDIGARIYNPGTGNWGNQNGTWAYSATYKINPPTVVYNNIKKLNDGIISVKDTLSNFPTDSDLDLKADIGDIDIISAPNTTLDSFSVNAGGVGYKVFNNFSDINTNRSYTKVKLNNPSGSPRQFKVIKLAVDGTTTTDIQTFTFPASGTHEVTLTAPTAFAPGERIGIEMLESSFRGSLSGDIGARQYNPSTGNWSNPTTTWAYSASGFSIEYGTLKAVSDAIVTLQAGGGSYPTTLYKYDTSGGAMSLGRFSVYVQYEESASYYVRFDIDRFVDTAIRANLWRIAGAQQCTYNLQANTMVQTGNQMLHTSESEYVIEKLGATDHTGGYHGDEILTDVTFFIDDLPVSLTANISLTACNHAFYIQKSNMLETDNPTTKNIIKHIKRTDFKNAGYTCHNNLEFIAIPTYPLDSTSFKAGSLYNGLFCTGLPNAKIFYSQSAVYTTATHSSSGATTLNQPGYRDLWYYHDTNKLAAFATSKLIKATSNLTDVTEAINNIQQLQVFDRSVDCKYYCRAQAESSNIETYPFVIGDVIECESSIKFMLKP